MKFSYCMLPDYSFDEMIDMIKTADELGFYACYSVDETWHKDLWVLFSAARETKNIRFGPNVTHVFLREPTLICQQMASLDELTGGRTEIVVSTGNFGLLSQYKIDWEGQKPLSRLKEAIHVMRTFLDEGAITFEGDFFKYAGLYTFARPVQEGGIPIKMGAMKGPRSFRTAGEIADGMHQALAYSREAYDYSSGAARRKAPRRPAATTRHLDNGAWVVTVVSEDSEAAKQAARDPRRLLHLLDAARAARPPRDRRRRAQAGVDALGGGDVAKAISLFEPHYAEKLSLAGTPEEVVEQIKADIEPAGVNHMILSLADPALVKLFSGEDVPNVPNIQGQLKLVADRVMPAFG